LSSNHGNEQNKKSNLLFVICYLSSPRSGVVCDLLNPRPMWPRTLYFALLFPAFHGLSIADELNAFTPPTLDHPLKVKVVVVAMFEVGADTGDVPGEFQFWVERRKLDHVISFPAAYHDVRTDGNGRPRRESIGEVYTLNSGLVHWAYELTRSIRLADNEKAQRDRARYHGSSRALAGPEVLMGATLSSSTYWHGKLLNQGAHDWVK
jgi:purine nucleoside permease